VVARWSRPTRLLCAGPGSTGMGDRLREGKSPWFVAALYISTVTLLYLGLLAIADICM